MNTGRNMPYICKTSKQINKKKSAYGEGIIDPRCEVGTEYECTGDEGPVVGGVLFR